MPLRSMSPLTVERTSVSRTLRAAAMLASPAVRQAAWGACRTASRVANRVAVSTPLRIGSSIRVSVVGIWLRLLPGGVGGSDGREQALAGDPSGGQRHRLLVDGGAELLLEGDEG